MNDGLIQEQHYTYEEWLKMDIEGRSELIDGQIYMMADPTEKHQLVSGELYGQIWSYLKGKPCLIFYAPYSVRLFDSYNTAYEPDIVVLCDQSKRRNRGCVGAPDMIIEILSPSTAKNDKVTKKQDYMKAGVKEYWIVDPEHNFVDAYRLVDDRYFQQTYCKGDMAPVQILPDCVVDLSLVFRDTAEAAYTDSSH